ncbi:MAG: cadmium-translocating P-type ATPase [Bacteroidales bacterium]|nr:cadmium-translocating P-type ATPase [Candidatus Sodaliphilus fimicaballi]
MNKKQRKMLCRIIVSAVLTAIFSILPVDGWLQLALFVGVYILIGYDILRKAFRGMLNRRVFDENFLMVVATLGAFSLAIYEQHNGQEGDFTEAIAVMLLYQVGEFFQSYAVGRSRKNISSLMDIRPDYANIEDETGDIEQVDPDDVEVGQTIIVRPGEKVPIDGVVIEGESTLNTAALTGESLPRSIAVGEEVVSGSINMTGVLKIKTTKEFGESTVSKILELVEDSASHKSKSEDFIARFARVYTPAVCYGALALALLPPLAMLVMGNAPEWETWIYRALTFLVISCPCALVVSIPLSFFAGIGGASRQGVLDKGANILDWLARVKTVVMDKTGTLTLGVFEVTAMHDGHDHDKEDEQEKQRLIEIAALVECASSHPISKSIQRAYGKVIDHSRVSDIKEVSGQGITAVVDGQQVAVGNETLMHSMGIESCHCHMSGTLVHIAIDGVYAGHIVLGDLVKPHAREAIQAMREAGVTRTVMLTGDSDKVAREVTGKLGIDTVYSQLLPADKVTRIEQLLATAGKGEKVAFVGDGMNDAPVLSRADIGIAMGGVGSDAAIEAADVVLMDDEPLKISKAIRMARKTMRIVWQNIIMTFGVKGVCLALGAVGIANMWLAIFADTGIMIIAVLNAIRAMRFKD